MGPVHAHHTCMSVWVRFAHVQNHCHAHLHRNAFGVHAVRTTCGDWRPCLELGAPARACPLHTLQLRSEEMGSLIAHAGDEGRPIAFCIGGPYGHSAAVRARADRLVRLSAMVMNHQVGCQPWTCRSKLGMCVCRLGDVLG